MAGKSISTLLYTFLMSVVGLALTPTVADSVTTAVENLTGASADILALFPLFWVLMMIGIPIASVYVYMKEGE